MDRTDKRILEIMQGNARISYQELGDKLGISRVAAMKRVRKLEQEGIIRGYNTYICREDELTMLIDIVTKPETFEEVMNYCLTQTAFVRQIFRTTKANHIHMVAVSDSAEELEYLTKMIRKHCAEKIDEIECHAVTEVIKDVYGKIRMKKWHQAESAKARDERGRPPARKNAQWDSGGIPMFEVNEKNSKIIEMVNRDLDGWTLEEIRKKNGGHFRYTVSLNDQFLGQDINELELSVRSYNCLKRAGVSTIGELVDRIDSYSDLLKMRNLGQKSASEIMLYLFLNNYMFLKPEKRKAYLKKVLKINGLSDE